MENPILVAQANGSLGEPLHPYFPAGVNIPSYVANSMSTAALLAWFALGCSIIFLTTRLAIHRAHPSLESTERWTIVWFVLCGFIHLFFEGYFSYNFMHMAGNNDLFGQLWKEYSLSDSRYLTQDAFVVCMETITASCWGPLSFLCAYFIVVDHPMRHPVQLIISLGQFYGLILYFATYHFNEQIFSIVYCRPEDIYFWAYYFLCNFFWVVIPIILIVSSCRETAGAFAMVKTLQRAAGKKDL
ncbi:hypothetical protein G7046_g8862 [Stylonectria norvegica]|nr:hypothetical protein G7046_g8862 [Stylonectria norvegica]